MDCLIAAARFLRADPRPTARCLLLLVTALKKITPANLSIYLQALWRKDVCKGTVPMNDGRRPKSGVWLLAQIGRFLHVGNSEPRCRSAMATPCETSLRFSFPVPNTSISPPGVRRLFSRFYLCTTPSAHCGQHMLVIVAPLQGPKVLRSAVPFGT